ncbi:phosphatidate cytidylyltransferase [Lipingzhangella sp. LS1_29]|uniref:Phosphatidate cytidylyltransferase n=1 Tax=Lipingzhangella rawalii TaxID=2055835 RepID=A0ABU2H6Y7_9ACTN|nr:phosphatidate cytidylyltransferase [Lipingzhangella rawalii]MDS1270615.1 phosphatidate cytidylyltransferase [Lipingzhangella rawalii]
MTHTDPTSGNEPESSEDTHAGPSEGGQQDRRFVLHKPGGEPVRAGRNLPLAVGTGLALGALVLASLFTYKATFVAILVAALAVGLRELNRAFSAQGTRIALVPLAVGGTAMLVGAYFEGTEWLFGALALTAIAALTWRLGGGADGYVRDVGASLFTIVYVPLMLGFWLLLLNTPDDGRARLIAFIIVTIASDIGGYFAGILFGRHKMAPTISPNKTWEGFGGSLLACVLAGVLTVMLLLDGPSWVGMLLGAAVCLAAIVGDLIESLIKRDTGVKDMGSFLPGHGGLLDRLDSLLIAGPVAWLVLLLV